MPSKAAVSEPQESLQERLAASAEFLRTRMVFPPQIGLVLGSGFGAVGDRLQELVSVPYADVPYFPQPYVSGHAGKVCFGLLGGVPVVCLQGRVHLYEGHSPEAVVYGVRTLARLGVSSVVLTNAAGGLEPSWSPGDLMLITDHLNLTGTSPLLGPNEAALGPRFPDMSQAYDAELQAHARRAAEECRMPLHEGVFVGILGPSYETPAEIRMLQKLGGHAVAMSTVLETVALRHMGVRVGGLSLLANHAAGLTGEPLTHAEVEACGQRRQEDMFLFLKAWIARIGSGTPVNR